MARYVVSLPPVTVMTPAGDVVTEWRRDRSAVRSLFASAISGRSPAHVPITSSGVSFSVVA